MQGFQKPNNVSNYSLTTYQPPTKVVGKVVSSSTQNENLCVDETADASLRDASPQTLESVEEEKELPAVTDCTTLTLVEAVPSQSASLLEKNQDLGVDQEISHEDNFSAAPADSNLENLSQTQNQAQPGLSASLVEKNKDLSGDASAHCEDTFSAAPVASNLENLNQPQDQAQPSLSASLMAENQNCSDEPGTSHEDTFSAVPADSNLENLNQPQNQAQPSLSALLMAEKQNCSDEAIAHHKDTFSAAPAKSNLPAQEPKAHHEGVCAVAADSNPEKWSYEAVVERSRVRPWRMEKLRIAEQWRENPGDDFLMECWADDPALRIVIKKLVIKCPQWGLVAADGVLVRWEE